MARPIVGPAATVITAQTAENMLPLLLLGQSPSSRMAMSWSANTATGQLWQLPPNAGWLSGLNGNFFIEQIQIVIVPGQIVAAQIALFDTVQGEL